MMPNEAYLDDCLELVDSLQVATGLVATFPMLCIWKGRIEQIGWPMQLKETKTNWSFGDARGCSVEVKHILLLTSGSTGEITCNNSRMLM